MSETTLHILLTIAAVADVAMMFWAGAQRLQKILAGLGVILLIFLCCAAYVSFPSQNFFARIVCVLPAAIGVLILRLDKNMPYARMRFIIAVMTLIAIVLMWI